MNLSENEMLYGRVAILLNKCKRAEPMIALEDFE